MTIPMPGPPEPVPHELDALPHKLTDDPWPYCSGCAAENRIRLADPKRLTDAECAAHYWQAEAYAFFLAANEDQDGQWTKWFDHKTTWHRFSAYPHALEES